MGGEIKVLMISNFTADFFYAASVRAHMNKSERQRKRESKREIVSSALLLQEM